MIYGIGCVDQQFGIGFQNALPTWNLPHDMRRFRELTKDNIVVMGRSTYASIGNKPLKDRKLNIIITSNPDKYESIANEVVFMTLDQWLEYTTKTNDDFYVIGGAVLWKSCYEQIDVFYLSFANDTFVCDTYFDRFSWNDWLIEKRENYKEYKFYILKNNMVQ